MIQHTFTRIKKFRNNYYACEEFHILLRYFDLTHLLLALNYFSRGGNQG